MPQPQQGPPPEPVNLGQGAGGFIIPPLPPGPGGPIPPVIPLGPYPVEFVPQPGPQPPVMPPMGRSPGVHSPVIPEPPLEWRMGMPEPDQYMDPMGPVRPLGAPYERYHPSGPSVYIHEEPEPEGPVVPSTPSDESGSPIPVPERMIVIPPSYTGHDSGSSTPSQQTYQPPPSPRALHIPPGDVPAVVPVAPSPLLAPVPPPGHIVHPSVGSEPLVVRPGQQGVPMQHGIPVSPSIAFQQPIQPTPIVIHPPVSVHGSVYGPSRAGSRASTRAPVVVVQSSQDRSPVAVPATIIAPPSDDHVRISPTIHGYPPLSTGGSRPYSPESHLRTHQVSRSPPHDVSRSPPRRLRRHRYRDDDRRSRSYSPDDRSYRGRYRSPEYDDEPRYRYRRYDDDDYYSPDRRRRRRYGRYDDPEDRSSYRHPDDYPPRRSGRGERDRPEEGEHSPEDPGRHSPHRRPSGRSDRSDRHPDIVEGDPGDRPRHPPSETRSTRGPGPVERDTTGALPPHPPASPAPPPTIIRVGGPHTCRSL